MNNSTSTTVGAFPIRVLHQVNSKVCLSLGGALNVVLVWLVVSRTPKEMRVYSHFLLQTCVSDILLLALTELVQPISFVVDGILLVVENGASARLAHPFNIVLFDLYLLVMFFGITGLVVQFLCRYLILCRQMELGVRHYFGILVAATLFEYAMFAAIFWIGYPGELFVHNDQVLQILGQDGRRDWHLRVVMVGDKSDWPCLVWYFAGILNNSLCYTIISVCGVKIVKYVRANLKMGGQQQRAAELNRQMTRNLVIQAALPMLNVSVYMVILYACFAPQSPFVLVLNMLSGLCLGWVPVLNPLVTILTVAPYRRTVLRLGKKSVSLWAVPSAKQPQQTQNGIVVERRTSKSKVAPTHTVGCTNQENRQPECQKF